MSGIEYVIDQLGQALQASHALIQEQRKQIEHLTAALAEATAPSESTST